MCVPEIIMVYSLYYCPFFDGLILYLSAQIFKCFFLLSIISESSFPYKNLFLFIFISIDLRGWLPFNLTNVDLSITFISAAQTRHSFQKIVKLTQPEKSL